MKKSLILGLLGLAASAVTSFGQGAIILDNYNTSGPYVTYGDANVPANGVSGATGGLGNKVVGNPGGTSPWTVGLYYVAGTVSIGADPNSNPTGDPSTFTGGLALGTGANSTAGINDVRSPGFPGTFLAAGVWNPPGSSSAGGQTYTLELVAYSGADYASSTYRGHSAAFQIVTSGSTSTTPNQVGSVMPSFSVFTTSAVPEPSILALSGLGAAALMLIRRKK